MFNLLAPNKGLSLSFPRGSRSEISQAPPLTGLLSDIALAVEWLHQISIKHKGWQLQDRPFYTRQMKVFCKLTPRWAAGESRNRGPRGKTPRRHAADVQRRHPATVPPLQSPPGLTCALLGWHLQTVARLHGEGDGIVPPPVRHFACISPAQSPSGYFREREPAAYAKLLRRRRTSRVRAPAPECRAFPRISAVAREPRGPAALQPSGLLTGRERSPGCIS